MLSVMFNVSSCLWPPFNKHLSRSSLCSVPILPATPEGRLYVWCKKQVQRSKTASLSLMGSSSRNGTQPQLWVKVMCCPCLPNLPGETSREDRTLETKPNLLQVNCAQSRCPLNTCVWLWQVLWDSLKWLALCCCFSACGNRFHCSEGAQAVIGIVRGF